MGLGQVPLVAKSTFQFGRRDLMMVLGLKF